MPAYVYSCCSLLAGLVGIDGACRFGWKSSFFKTDTMKKVFVREDKLCEIPQWKSRKLVEITLNKPSHKPIKKLGLVLKLAEVNGIAHLVPCIAKVVNGSHADKAGFKRGDVMFGMDQTLFLGEYPSEVIMGIINQINKTSQATCLIIRSDCLTPQTTIRKRPLGCLKPSIFSTVSNHETDFPITKHRTPLSDLGNSFNLPLCINSNSLQLAMITKQSHCIVYLPNSKCCEQSKLSESSARNVYQSQLKTNGQTFSRNKVIASKQLPVYPRNTSNSASSSENENPVEFWKKMFERTNAERQRLAEENWDLIQLVMRLRSSLYRQNSTNTSKRYSLPNSFEKNGLKETASTSQIDTNSGSSCENEIPTSIAEKYDSRDHSLDVTFASFPVQTTTAQLTANQDIYKNLVRSKYNILLTQQMTSSIPDHVAQASIYQSSDNKFVLPTYNHHDSNPQNCRDTGHIGISFDSATFEENTKLSIFKSIPNKSLQRKKMCKSLNLNTPAHAELLGSLEKLTGMFLEDTARLRSILKI